jgi:exonuclease III
VSARFRTSIRNINIIQRYAPTEGGAEEHKVKYYSQLNKVLREKTRKRDIVILIGDMNAKVGAENEGLEHIMGIHGLGNQNRNGELFVDLCAREDMVSGGTLFPHKNCHRVTWISQDYNTENQIDHFAISRKWRISLQDVRNKRGADTESDHHLVVALFKLKVMASQRKFQTCARRFNIDNLKQTEVMKEFKIK